MLNMAVPLVLAELGWMAMGVVDTIMVGRLPHSAEAIGAVGLGGILFFSVAIFGIGLLLGLDTLVSQAFGAGDVADCHHSLTNGVYMALGLSPVLIGIILVIVPYLGRFGVHPDVLAYAVPYLKTLNWSLPPLLLYNTFRRYLQGMNLVRPVTFVLISANLVNLAGNYAFVFGHFGAPAYGVVGSAWSTTVARIYMAVFLLGYILYYDWRHKTKLPLVVMKPDPDRIGRLFRLGLPAATQIGMEVAVFATAAAFISKLGPLVLAAHQIALNAASVTYMVPLGISSAAAVRVGQALGRKDPAAAADSGWAALILGSAFMLCAAIAFVLFPRYIVLTFSREQALITVGTRLLLVAAVFQLFDGLQAVATGALRGAGNTRTPMICSTLAYWVLGLPFGYLLCFRLQWGAPGMWTGLCLGLVLMGSVLLLVWQRTTRQWREQSAANLAAAR